MIPAASTPSLALIGFDRPWALALLILPIALFLLVRLRARPEEDATGTLEIWRRAARDAPREAARSRRRSPPAVWLLCMALCCAAIAVAGPLPSADAESVLVVVDRSPSMYLRDGEGTRLDWALAIAHEWLAGHDPASVRWVAPPNQPIPRDSNEFKAFTFGRADPMVGIDLPEGWKRAPTDERAPPDFEAFDRPGCLWITDRLPAVDPRDASYACSGGPAVEGPVGVHAGHFVDWDGSKLVETARPSPKRSILAGDELPEPVLRAVRAWARARGFEITKNVDDVTALRVMGRSYAEARYEDVVVGRDGWRAHVRGDGDAPTRMVERGPSPSLMPLEVWLRSESPDARWVTHAPGIVSIAFTKLDRIEGDPAAFAVSLAQLLDESVLPAPGCVPLSERVAAGDTRTLHFGSPSRNEEVSRWPAMFAISALVLSLIAAAVAASVRPNIRATLPSRLSS